MTLKRSHKLLIALTVAITTAAPFAYAQMTADFGKSNGGSLRVGHDSAACSAAKDGALRYNSANGNKWEYCLGSTWTPF